MCSQKNQIKFYPNKLYKNIKWVMMYKYKNSLVCMSCRRLILTRDK